MAERRPPKAERRGLPASGLAAELIPLLRGARTDNAATDQASGERTVRRTTDAPILLFADRVAPEHDTPVRVPHKRSLVSFELAGGAYAIPTAQVLEVLRVGAITRVPNAPRHVRGVANARGRALPVVELRTCLGLLPMEINKDSRILAVESAGRTVGLLVDRVVNVRSVAVDEVIGANEHGVVAVCHVEDGGMRVLCVDVLLGADT